MNLIQTKSQTFIENRNKLLESFEKDTIFSAENQGKTIEENNDLVHNNPIKLESPKFFGSLVKQNSVNESQKSLDFEDKKIESFESNQEINNIQEINNFYELRKSISKEKLEENLNGDLLGLERERKEELELIHENKDLKIEMISEKFRNEEDGLVDSNKSYKTDQIQTFVEKIEYSIVDKKSTDILILNQDKSHLNDYKNLNESFNSKRSKDELFLGRISESESFENHSNKSKASLVQSLKKTESFDSKTQEFMNLNFFYKQDDPDDSKIKEENSLENFYKTDEYNDIKVKKSDSEHNENINNSEESKISYQASNKDLSVNRKKVNKSYTKTVKNESDSNQKIIKRNSYPLMKLIESNDKTLKSQYSDKEKLELLSPEESSEKKENNAAEFSKSFLQN